MFGRIHKIPTFAGDDDESFRVVLAHLITLNDEDHGPFVKPGVIIEEEEVEVGTKWTDSDSDSEEEYTKWTDLPLLKHGSLTALEIEEERDGYWIQRIRAR